MADNGKIALEKINYINKLTKYLENYAVGKTSRETTLKMREILDKVNSLKASGSFVELMKYLDTKKQEIEEAKNTCITLKKVVEKTKTFYTEKKGELEKYKEELQTSYNRLEKIKGVSKDRELTTKQNTILEKIKTIDSAIKKRDAIGEDLDKNYKDVASVAFTIKNFDGRLQSDIEKFADKKAEDKKTETIKNPVANFKDEKMDTSISYKKTQYGAIKKGGKGASEELISVLNEIEKYIDKVSLDGVKEGEKAPKSEKELKEGDPAYYNKLVVLKLLPFVREFAKFSRKKNPYDFVDIATKGSISGKIKYDQLSKADKIVPNNESELEKKSRETKLKSKLDIVSKLIGSSEDDEEEKSTYSKAYKKTVDATVDKILQTYVKFNAPAIKNKIEGLRKDFSKDYFDKMIKPLIEKDFVDKKAENVLLSTIDRMTEQGIKSKTVFKAKEGKETDKEGYAKLDLSDFNKFREGKKNQDNTKGSNLGTYAKQQAKKEQDKLAQKLGIEKEKVSDESGSSGKVETLKVLPKKDVTLRLTEWKEKSKETVMINLGQIVDVNTAAIGILSDFLLKNDWKSLEIRKLVKNGELLKQEVLKDNAYFIDNGKKYYIFKATKDNATVKAIFSGEFGEIVKVLGRGKSDLKTKVKTILSNCSIETESELEESLFNY